MFFEFNEFGGIGGSAEAAIAETVEGLGECRLVGGEVLERGFGKEVLFAESPVGFWWVIHGGGVERCEEVVDIIRLGFEERLNRDCHRVYRTGERIMNRVLR